MPRISRIMAQLDLFPQPTQTVSAIPSVDAVRARLDAMLGRLRAARSDLLFTLRELAYWEVVTPQMSGCPRPSAPRFARNIQPISRVQCPLNIERRPHPRVRGGDFPG